MGKVLKDNENQSDQSLNKNLCKEIKETQFSKRTSKNKRT